MGEFAHQLEILAERAFGARREWSDWTKKLVEGQFWVGMSETLRVSLSLYNYTTYDELVQSARKMEMNTGAIR